MGVGRICERGVRVPMASAGARTYNGGLGVEPPASVQGGPVVTGTFVPWNFRSQEPSFPGTFVPMTDIKMGTFVPKHMLLLLLMILKGNLKS